MGSVAAVALLAGAAPTQAAVSSAYARGELTARSNAGDSIVIRCAADGKVWVNRAPPRTGPVACSRITSISVVGGPMRNVIDLSLVTRSRFSALSGGRVGIRGGGGDDRIVGSALGDSIAGDDGNDVLDGNTGNDRLEGGVGYDTLLGFDGRDGLIGGEGDDRLEGEAGADRLEGQGGNDKLFGGDDPDTLLGGEGGDDVLNGHGGDDTISGGGGNDTLSGEADSDTLAGDAGDDQLTGDLPFASSVKGDDVLDGGEGTKDRVSEGGDEGFTLTNDQLRGLGTDTLSGVEEAYLIGGSSPNTIDASVFSGNVTLNGGGGNDTLIGGRENDDDIFDGGTHADTVAASGDLDFTVTGDRSAGTLAGLGTDTLKDVETVDLTGGAGDNKLNASAFSGDAVLDGGAGGDEVTGGAGDDRLTGGADDDTLAGNNGYDLVDESGDFDFTLSDTELRGTGGRGSDGLTDIEEAHLTGGDGDNQFDASLFSGRAVLDGQAGGDKLTGGTNADRLTGAAGDDTLAGNNGGDRVVESGDQDFTVEGDASAGTLAGLGADTLTDVETVDLTGGASANRLDASTFSGKVVLTGGAEGDALTGGKGDDTLAGGDGGDGLLGGEGNDTETGGAGDDDLAGGPGNDTLGGNVVSDEAQRVVDPGVDAFSGDAGDDVLRTRDLIAESSIACGSDVDTVRADLGDTTNADCEAVNRPLPPRAARSVVLRANPTETRSGGSVRLAGNIRAPANPAGCASNQVVALQRARPGTGRFGTFKQVRTNRAAAYSLTIRVTRTFLYRAAVSDTPNCFAAVSKKQRVTVVGA